MMKGESVMLYGKREFTEGETCNFISSYNNLYNNVVVEEEGLEGLFLSVEKDLNLLCVIGLEEELRD